MKQKENIHDGHRTRLFNMADRAGLENLDKIQALELILCYVLPRGDVNPLSHKLLDKYKDILSVLQAPKEDLMLVKGVGEKTAQKLHMLMNVFNLLIREKATQRKKINNLRDACYYVENLMKFTNNEEMHIIGIGSNNEVIDSRMLASGLVDMVNIDMSEVSYFVKSIKPKKVILVHNHPNGYCMPSKSDIEASKDLVDRFKFSGSELIDNMIVGADGVYSIMNDIQLMTFKKNDEQKEFEEQAIKEEYANLENLENIFRD